MAGFRDDEPRDQKGQWSGFQITSTPPAVAKKLPGRPAPNYKDFSTPKGQQIKPATLYQKEARPSRDIRKGSPRSLEEQANAILKRDVVRAKAYGPPEEGKKQPRDPGPLKRYPLTPIPAAQTRINQRMPAAPTGLSQPPTGAWKDRLAEDAIARQRSIETQKAARQNFGALSNRVLSSPEPVSFVVYGNTPKDKNYRDNPGHVQWIFNPKTQERITRVTDHIDRSLAHIDRFFGKVFPK